MLFVPRECSLDPLPRAGGAPFDPLVLGAGLVAGGVIVGLSGVLATYSVVRQPPAGVLAQAS